MREPTECVRWDLVVVLRAAMRLRSDHDAPLPLASADLWLRICGCGRLPLRTFASADLWLRTCGCGRLPLRTCGRTLAADFWLRDLAARRHHGDGHGMLGLPSISMRRRVPRQHASPAYCASVPRQRAPHACCSQQHSHVGCLRAAVSAAGNVGYGAIGLRAMALAPIGCSCVGAGCAVCWRAS